MDISNQKFEEWRNEQITSLIRMGYTDAAKAFRDLGSVQWAGWQAAWQASRESLVVELPAAYRSAGSKFELLNKQHMIDVLTENGIRTK